MKYDIKSDIEEILETNQDAALGYQKAADNLNNSELTTIFNRLAQQRKLFNEELINELRPLGVTPEVGGSLKGYFHRNWIDLKTVFADREDKTIIEESLTGENESFVKYAEIVDKGILPKVIQDKVLEQKTFIFGAINQLEDFKKTV